LVRFVFPDKVPLKINRGHFGPNKWSECGICFRILCQQ